MPERKSVTSVTMDGGLGRVADVMTPAPLVLSATDNAAKASAAFRAHRVPVAPVLDAGGLVGVLSAVDLLDALPFRRVTDVMTRGIVPATSELPLLQAHALLTSQGLDVLPVLQGGRVIGQLELTAVLRAIHQQTDPLTGLPWATALRLWAADALARGREVAVLFADLDNFREVNKTFGHVIGDSVLHAVAELMQRCIDPTTDLLCRYGGDEFAIATIRSEEEARVLASRIEDVVVVPVGEAGRPVTVSVGYAGGRRHEEREPNHAPATVDDLLALASRASTFAKASAAAAARRAAWQPQDTPLPEARVRLVDVRVGPAEGRTAVVRLRLGSREVAGEATDAAPEPARPVGLLVADATLRALHGILGEADVYAIEDILDSLAPSYQLVVAVVASRRPGGEHNRYIGGAAARELPVAACKAVLDAVNRPLGRRLAALLDRPDEA